jgi:hypothetical protein
MSASRCFEIDVRRATILEPDECLQGASTVPLATSFLLVGGSETPIQCMPRRTGNAMGVSC